MALEDAANEIDMAVMRKGMKGLSPEATFGGVPSFMRRNFTKDLTDVDLAILGVPFDSATTNRTGTRLGPRAIRAASSLQGGDPPFGWDVDPFSDMNMIDYGDLAYDYARIDRFPAALRAQVKTILDAGAACLTLGGDHYITYPILQAHAEKYGPLSLIQFDAHTDTWEDDDFDRIDHGTMFYKAIKEGIIVPERSVQVGIRTVVPDTMGMNIIDAPTVHEQGVVQTVRQIKEIIGDNPSYLTFDIDGLDPAFAPGTGTPVAGGFSSAQAMAMLRGLAGINVKGMDVVEVSPPFDPTDITAIAGAHIATELACLWASGQKGR
jgi:agmatinase